VAPLPYVVATLALCLCLRLGSLDSLTLLVLLTSVARIGYIRERLEWKARRLYPSPWEKKEVLARFGEGKGP
jgi:hypothetical protein